MNFLKKKLKPLATSLTGASTSTTKSTNLEDDLYDEYVVEAPPHPSELIALSVDPSQIDVNDPDKLRELYRKAKEEGKDKQTNSILLAKQRQKEELEEKKRTREEWKFFDNLTSRVEQVVKDSQKTLEQLKDRSAVNKLAEPDYELRQTADEVFRPTTGVKVEKTGESDWVAFGASGSAKAQAQAGVAPKAQESVDEFGLDKRKLSLASEQQQQLGAGFVAAELLEDLGIDLRSEEQRCKEQQLERRGGQEAEQQKPRQQRCEHKAPADQPVAVRPRPRPSGAPCQAAAAAAAAAVPAAASATSSANSGEQATEKSAPEVDPFDTSFLAEQVPASEQQVVSKKAEPVDPFDTSYVDLS